MLGFNLGLSLCLRCFDSLLHCFTLSRIRFGSFNIFCRRGSTFLKRKQVSGLTDLPLDGVNAGSKQEHVIWLGLVAQRLDVALTHDELGCQFALLCGKLSLDHAECLTLRLSEDHLFLLVAFSLQDLLLSLRVGDIDVSLSGTLGAKNFCALAPLSLSLEGHACQNLIRWLNVSHLIPEQLNAPKLSLF